MEAALRRTGFRNRDTGNFDVGPMFDTRVMPITIAR